ncbi:MAG: hypothetical protein FWB98_03545, partial [Defluviitaleaceae bacterium]|nr:hypothetical protein [Defluviitaleaceae bacterium]
DLPDFQHTVQIIGTHNGGLNRVGGGNSTILPVTALQFIRGDLMMYVGYTFYIDPIHNRNLDYIALQMQIAMNPLYLEDPELFRHLETVGMGNPFTFVLFDEELRLTVGQMEQNFNLLLLLRPIVLAVSAAMAVGFALLMMLQNAKQAAIMRVLGYSKSRSRLLLAVENLSVTALGVLLAVAGWLFAPAQVGGALPLFALLYLTATILGVIIGTTTITRKSPLELLQVCE